MSLSSEIQQKMMQMLQIEEQKTDLSQLAVLSRVGMKVASATSSELDADSISASSTALIDLGIRLSNSVEHGALREILLHNQSGYGLLMAVNDEYIIFGALGEVFRIGYYMGYLREVARKINALISGGELTEMSINLQEEELKKMQAEKEKIQEQEKTIGDLKPSVERDQEAMQATLAFLEEWGSEDEEDLAVENNVVSIPESMTMKIPADIKATPATSQAPTEIADKAHASEDLYGMRVYDDEVPPIPLDDYTPMSIEEEGIEEVIYEEPAIEEPVVEEPRIQPTEIYQEESTTLDSFEPPTFDEFGVADEYDMDFEVEEDEQFADILEDLGWTEEKGED